MTEKRWTINLTPLTGIGWAVFWTFVVWVVCVPDDHQLRLIEAMTK